MRRPKNLPRHELIGLWVEVVESENEYEEGIYGKVVDETKSTLKVEAREEKTIKKVGRKFKFELPSGEEVKVGGDLLEGRPEERIKRAKKWA